MPSAPVDPDAAAKGVGRMQMGPTRPNHVVDADRFPPELGLPTAAGLVCSTSCRHRAWGTSARQGKHLQEWGSATTAQTRSRPRGQVEATERGVGEPNRRENCARKDRAPLSGCRPADLRSAALLVAPLAWRAPQADLLGAVRDRTGDSPPSSSGGSVTTDERHTSGSLLLLLLLRFFTSTAVA